MTRTRVRPLLVAALALVLALLALAHPLGYRANLRTARVPLPAASAAPDDVVLAYVDAFNHRDWSTMTTIFPTRNVARFRAMGRFDGVTIDSSRPMSESDRRGGVGEQHADAYLVGVRLTYTGFDPDLAYTPGPNGWNYYLVRDRPTDRWVIADQGVL